MCLVHTSGVIAWREWAVVGILCHARFVISPSAVQFWVKIQEQRLSITIQQTSFCQVYCDRDRADTFHRHNSKRSHFSFSCKFIWQKLEWQYVCPFV